jgi:LCP family protein required for cell wall assembly
MTEDDLLETRVAEALRAARTDSRLAVQPWADAPVRIAKASRRRRMHHGSLAVTAVSVLVLATVGGGKLYLDRSLHTVQSSAVPGISGAAVLSGPGHLKPKPAAGKPFTVLILGVDSRAGTGSEYGSTADACGCSDTIMLARVNPQTSKISLLSIPRDTRVMVTGRNQVTKVNSAFGRGPDNSVATIEKALNVDINHWVVLDLAGFKAIVNAVGGVRMDIPMPIKDKNAGLDLTATGCQTLTGDQALAISRARELQYRDSSGHWVFDPTYEDGRQRREQTMMRVIAAHTVKSSLGNPLTAAKVINTFTAQNRLAVDNQVTSDELVNLAGDFAGFDASTMQTFTLPTYGKVVYDASAGKDLDFEILEPDKDAATIQAWYEAVQPAAAAPSATAPTATLPAPTTTGVTSSAGATAVPTKVTPAATSPARVAVSPNQPEPWDPRPCS